MAIIVPVPLKSGVCGGCKFHRLYASQLALLQSGSVLASMTMDSELRPGIPMVLWDRHGARQIHLFPASLCLSYFTSIILRFCAHLCQVEPVLEVYGIRHTLASQPLE